MRKMVKHLLKKFKYPPVEYDTAISTVIKQCCCCRIWAAFQLLFAGANAGASGKTVTWTARRLSESLAQLLLGAGCRPLVRIVLQQGSGQINFFRCAFFSQLLYSHADKNVQLVFCKPSILYFHICSSLCKLRVINVKTQRSRPSYRIYSICRSLVFMPIFS